MKYECWLYVILLRHNNKFEFKRNKIYVDSVSVQEIFLQLKNGRYKDYLRIKTSGQD
ncbi:hypothetical protein pb186bvf_000843 [Paramecium bursaria]